MIIGMLDWLTLRLDASVLHENIRDVFMQNTGRVFKVDRHGVIEWESIARETVRSDSHQIAMKFGSHLEIYGSPARVINPNNVFGSLDIKQCARDMIVFISRHFGVMLPMDLNQWDCTRIEVTRNYDMGSLANCLHLVDALKHVKVGRQKCKAEDNGVGWGYGSSLHMGKVYCKGPHLRMLVRQNRAHCSDYDLQKADRLIRLEYSLRRHLIRRIKKDCGLRWSEFSPEFLIDYHDKYFSQFISEVEVATMDNILALLLQNVGKAEGKIPTEGQARAAYDCYTRIRMMGPRVAQSTFTRTSWHRHLKNLGSIGLGKADLQHLNVIPIRKKQIELGNPVSCWDDIKLAEAI